MPPRAVPPGGGDALARPPPIDVPLQPDELKRLVEILMDVEDYALAHLALEAALRELPDDLELLSCAGACLMELGRAPEALRVLQRAADLDPSGGADLELGWSAMTQGRLDLAKAALVRALRRSPTNLLEIHYDGPFWTPVRYELEVLRAIEAAEGELRRARMPDDDWRGQDAPRAAETSEVCRPRRRSSQPSAQE